MPGISDAYRGSTDRPVKEQTYPDRFLHLTHVLARPWTYEQGPRGHLGLLEDWENKVPVGA